MEFYKIWKTKSGLIGVNKLTFNDLVMIEVTTGLFIMIMIAVLGVFFPIIFFVIYILLMMGLDSDDRGVTTRLGVNIVTIITTIYFLLDYHFGWYCHKLIGCSVYAETYDAIAIRNLSVALISIPLFFFGHEIYKESSNRLMRCVIFLVLIGFGLKYTNKISTYIITNHISQYNNAEIIKDRASFQY